MSNDRNNGKINIDNYISLSETNINCVNMELSKKISFYKTKNNKIISPEETHFNAVDFLQKIRISKYSIK